MHKHAEKSDEIASYLDLHHCPVSSFETGLIVWLKTAVSITVIGSCEEDYNPHSLYKTWSESV